MEKNKKNLESENLPVEMSSWNLGEESVKTIYPVHDKNFQIIGNDLNTPTSIHSKLHFIHCNHLKVI